MAQAHGTALDERLDERRLDRRAVSQCFAGSVIQRDNQAQPAHARGREAAGRGGRKDFAPGAPVVTRHPTGELQKLGTQERRWVEDPHHISKFPRRRGLGAIDDEARDGPRA
jgi:hypothetical protein